MELIKSIDETFKFDDKVVRVLGTYVNPYFIAKDICNILGLKNITEMLRNIPEKWRSSEIVNTSGGNQNMILISEPAVYKLIMRSNKKIAQKFQEVVCEEILPSIRRTGEYKMKEIIQQKEEENKLLEKEKKKLINKYEKFKKRELEKGYIIYVGTNNLDPEVFKVGTTINSSSRTSSLSTGTTEDFVIKKTWYCRYYKQIESMVKIRFDKYRTLNRKELYNIENFDEICAFIEKIVNFCNENDQEYFEELDKINKKNLEEQIKKEKKIKEELEFIENHPPRLIFIDTNRTDKKKCNKCLLLKSVTKFYINPKNKDINDKDYDLDNEEEYKKYIKKKYRSHCKKCDNAATKLHKKTIKINPNHNKKKCQNCENMIDNNNFFTNYETNELYEICPKCYIIENNLDTEHKQCISCHEIKSLLDYHKRDDNNTYRNNCKECRNSEARSRRDKSTVTCQYCKKEIGKTNLKTHHKTKSCQKAQGKNDSTKIK